MQAEADINKVLAAAVAADPDSDDDSMRMLQDALNWVLGGTGETADAFIEMYVADI